MKLKSTALCVISTLFVASCSMPGLNINQDSSGRIISSASKNPVSLTQRFKVTTDKTELAKRWNIVRPAGFQVKANAGTFDYKIKHATRTDAQCVRVKQIDDKICMAIFNTEGDTHATGTAEAYAVIFDITSGTTITDITFGEGEFNDIDVVNKTDIVIVGDDSSAGTGATNTAFIARFTWDGATGALDASKQYSTTLEGHAATAVVSMDQKQIYAVATGEKGYVYSIKDTGTGFSVINKVFDAVKDAGDFRAVAVDDGLRKLFVMDGGWDITSSKAPKIIYFDYVTGTGVLTKNTEYNLPNSAVGTGLGKDWQFTGVATETPGGQHARAKIVNTKESLIITENGGGLTVVKYSDGTLTNDLTSLVAIGPVPSGTPAIVNDVAVADRGDGTYDAVVSSGYYGLSHINFKPNDSGSHVNLGNYQLYEHPEVSTTEGTSTNSFERINVSGQIYNAIGNGKAGGVIYKKGNMGGAL